MDGLSFGKGIPTLKTLGFCNYFALGKWYEIDRVQRFQLVIDIRVTLEVGRK